MSKEYGNEEILDAYQLYLETMYKPRGLTIGGKLLAPSTVKAYRKAIKELIEESGNSWESVVKDIESLIKERMASGKKSADNSTTGHGTPLSALNAFKAFIEYSEEHSDLSPQVHDFVLGRKN